MPWSENHLLRMTEHKDMRSLGPWLWICHIYPGVYTFRLLLYEMNEISTLYKSLFFFFLVLLCTTKVNLNWYTWPWGACENFFWSYLFSVALLSPKKWDQNKHENKKEKKKPKQKSVCIKPHVIYLFLSRYSESSRALFRY